MRKLTRRIASGVLTALMVASSLPVDSLAKTLSSTIPSYKNGTITRSLTARDYVTNNDGWENLSFDLSGDSEGQSILSNISDSTYASSGWDYFDAIPGNTKSPGELTSDGGISGSGKYLKIYGDSFFQMSTKTYAVTNDKNSPKGYEVSFDYKSEPSSKGSPNAFFFRGDTGDSVGYQTNHETTLHLYESDVILGSSYEKNQTNKFIGGTGIALWVSDKHTLTLVIKKVLDWGDSWEPKYVDNEMINFYVDEDLTTWNNYRIVDNGRVYNASTKAYYSNQADICFYLNGKLLFTIQCNNYGQYATRKTYLNVTEGGTDGKGLSFSPSTSIGTDTSYYFKSCIVKDSGGQTITAVDGSLIRNYSRFGFASRNSGRTMGIDNFKVLGYQQNNATDKARIDGYNKVTTDGAIYLPITIRDYNNDGMLFEYNDQWEGNLSGLETGDPKLPLTKSDVKRGGAGKDDNNYTVKSEFLSNYGYQHTSYLDLSKGSPNAAATWTADSKNTIYTMKSQGNNDNQIVFTLSDADRFNGNLKKYVVVRYKTTSGGNKMTLFYSMDNNTGYSAAKSVSVDVTGDGTWHNAFLDLSGQSVWTGGTVISLRFDFLDAGHTTDDTIEIQYVAVVSGNGTVTPEYGDIYPYYTWNTGTEAFSKQLKFLGSSTYSTASRSTYGYALVRYKIDAAEEGKKVTVKYANGDSVVATSGEQLVYADGKWHDLFVKMTAVGSTVNFDRLQLYFDGTIKISTITPLKYVRFTGTATYGYNYGGATVCRDENGKKLVWIDRNDVDIGDNGTTKVYFVNVRYKTTATKLNLTIKTHNNFAEVENKTYTFEARGDNKWHTAAVQIDHNYKLGQCYLSCDNDEALDFAEAVFFHFKTSDADRIDKCKFYATYYNPNYEYKDQRGNNLVFGFLVYQNPASGSSNSYYNTFVKNSDPQVYFGTNYISDSATGVVNDLTKSGNRLLGAKSYNPGVSFDYKRGEGYLHIASITDADYGRFLTGVAIQCLTKSTLNSDGKPEYAEETVRLLASGLAYALREGISDDEVNDSYGFYNRVEGTVNDELYGKGNDFASFLRSVLYLCTKNEPTDSCETTGRYLFGTMSHYYIGKYEDAINKRSQLSLDYFKQNKGKVTCMEVAVYMLDNLYVSGQNDSKAKTEKTGNGYSMEIDEYDALALIKSTDQNGDPIYTFSSSRANTVYDTTNRVIYNTQTVKQPYYKRPDGNYVVSSGYPYYDYMFNPLGTGREYSKGDTSNKATALGYGDTESKYLAGDGVSTFSDYGDRYTGYNYNFSMEGYAKFTYHEGDNLYFRFMGDDDVYLFVNGKLILDLGGGHSRADAEVYLNEANTKHNLGLVEGETYEFKFFYMERHGFAGNFMIQTNIQLTDPGMPVDKSAYIGDTELAYGDNVQQDDLIEYEFSVTNTEDNNAGQLQYLYFNDEDLGFTLGYTEASDDKFVCKLGTYTDEKGNVINRTLADLTITVKDKNGNSTSHSTLDETLLKQLLKTGLKNGETLYVSGVKHYLTDAQIHAMTFKNTVSVSSYYKDGLSWKKLEANDSFLVNISELWAYLWAGHERQYDFKDLLTDDMRIGSSTYGEIKSRTENNRIGVYISDANKNAYTDPDHKISGTTLTGDYAGSYDLSSAKGTSKEAKTGTYSFNFTLIAYETENEKVEKFGPYGVTVFVYDLVDTNYVLDYGLPVRVYADPGDDGKNGTSFIDEEKDTITLSTNTDELHEILGFGLNLGAATTGKVTGSPSLTYTANRNYGKVAGGTDSGTPVANLTYTPTSFINGIDTVQVAVGIYDKTVDKSYTIRSGVQMYKDINFMPASIMYYEETIGSITYKQGMTTGKLTGATTKYQSSKQDESYGYDAAYSNESSTEVSITNNSKFSYWGGKSLTLSAGEGGFDGVGNNYNFSNGTYAKLETSSVGDYKSPVATFDFKGTGFELISYTNYSSATVRVDVLDKTTGTKVKGKLVVTTYTHGSLNQVPIIDIDGLAYGEYTVNIYVIKPLSDGRGTHFYLDGVRIYDPAKNDNNITDNYKSGEKNATVEELRADILKNNNTVGIINQKLGQKIKFTVGQSYVERVDGLRNGNGNKWNYSDATGDFTYENVGPNNEVYLKSQVNALVFKVKPTGDVSDVLFEIEAKKITDVPVAWRDCIGKNGNGDAYYPNVDRDAKDGYKFIDSYTSRYYAMDVSKCIKNSDGSYTVIVLFNTPDTDGVEAIVSLTNVKYSNCTLLPIDLTEAATTSASADAQLLEDIAIVMEQVNEGYEINDKLIINSVSASAAYEADDDVIIKVSASDNAETVRVFDENGDELEIKSVKAVTYGENKMFTVNLGTMEAGTHSFTVEIADESGRTCAKTVSKTIIIEE